MSKWCSWELGLFDGISNGKCCILPVIKEKKTFIKDGNIWGCIHIYRIQK